MSDSEFGSDGQIHDTADKPLANLAGAERAIDPPKPADPTEASEPASAAQRLRAFEDEHLGEDAPRINGAVERGVGSPFAAMTPQRLVHHAAIEKMVEAEKAVITANAALSAAQAAHDAAVKAVDDAGNAADKTV
jgi:hypothetical protein